MKRALVSLSVLLMSVPVSTCAQIAAVPSFMNFQGRLTGPDGAPVPNGNYASRFSFWTAPTDGSEKWNQTVKVDYHAMKAENVELKARLDALTAAVAKLKSERK